MLYKLHNKPVEASISWLSRFLLTLLVAAAFTVPFRNTTLIRCLRTYHLSYATGHRVKLHWLPVHWGVLRDQSADQAQHGEG